MVPTAREAETEGALVAAMVAAEIQSWSSGRPTLHGLQPDTPETAVLGDRAVHGDVDEVERRLDDGERVGAIAPDLGGTPRTIRNAGLPLALNAFP